MPVRGVHLRPQIAGFGIALDFPTGAGGSNGSAKGFNLRRRVWHASAFRQELGAVGMNPKAAIGKACADLHTGK